MTSPSLPAEDVDALRAIVRGVRGAAGPTLFLTGAGISAESGIPTFRGEEGYWRVGSRNYHPQELATRAAFGVERDTVWAWYLYRRSVCRAKEPNAAHRAIADLQRALPEGEVFVVTQNVDGLHGRAGSPPEQTFAIHGDIEFMRCARSDAHPLVPVPGRFDVFPRDRALASEDREALRCSACDATTRPHVLWFDESYDERFFRFESSHRVAAECRLLVVIGTTGATNLPLQIGAVAARRGVPMIVINPEPNPFSEWLTPGAPGVFLEGRAGEWVPTVVDAIRDGR